MGDWTNHLETFQLQELVRAAQVEGDEVAQVLEGHLTLELQFEGHRAAAIGAGHHTHLHHQVAGFGAGVDQLTSHREIVVPLWQGIG